MQQHDNVEPISATIPPSKQKKIGAPDQSMPIQLNNMKDFSHLVDRSLSKVRKPLDKQKTAEIQEP